MFCILKFQRNSKRVEMVAVRMEEMEIGWKWVGRKRKGTIIGQKIITC